MSETTSSKYFCSCGKTTLLDGSQSCLCDEIESLRAEVERLRQAIERHKERIPFKEPDYEDYQLWKALDGEE